MLTIRLRMIIRRSRETVFQTLTNLSGYRSWLSPSAISAALVPSVSGPLPASATYLRRGSLGEFQGTVAELEPGCACLLREETTQRLAGGPTKMILTIQYRFTEQGLATRVDCTVRLRASGLLLFGTPLFLRLFGREQLRTLEALKSYLEARVR